MDRVVALGERRNLEIVARTPRDVRPSVIISFRVPMDWWEKIKDQMENVNASVAFGVDDAAGGDWSSRPDGPEASR